MVSILSIFLLLLELLVSYLRNHCLIQDYGLPLWFKSVTVFVYLSVLFLCSFGLTSGSGSWCFFDLENILLNNTHFAWLILTHFSPVISGAPSIQILSAGLG